MGVPQTFGASSSVHPFQETSETSICMYIYIYIDSHPQIDGHVSRHEMGYWEQPCIVMGMFYIYIYRDNIVGFFLFLSLSLTKYWGYKIFWNIVGY